MNYRSRSENSIINMLIGIVNRILLLILNFVIQTVFVKKMGAEYTGINGLFGNILSVLSLAEFGIGTVMIYSLYKPIAENDFIKINTLMKYYRKIYVIVAGLILTLGISIIPFLGMFVVSNLAIKDLAGYYVLYLLNSVCSYFCIYKTTLINADQKVFIVDCYRTLFSIIQIVLQVVALEIGKNYYVFLIIQLLCTLANNITISIKADQLYPFLKEKLILPKEKSLYGEINEYLKSTFVYKIGVIVMNQCHLVKLITLLFIYIGSEG